MLRCAVQQCSVLLETTARCAVQALPIYQANHPRFRFYCFQFFLTDGVGFAQAAWPQTYTRLPLPDYSPRTQLSRCFDLESDAVCYVFWSDSSWCYECYDLWAQREQTSPSTKLRNPRRKQGFCIPMSAIYPLPAIQFIKIVGWQPMVSWQGIGGGTRSIRNRMRTPVFPLHSSCMPACDRRTCCFFQTPTSGATAAFMDAMDSCFVPRCQIGHAQHRPANIIKAVICQFGVNHDYRGLIPQ